MAEPGYVTLMSSLPYHGSLFAARQTPLSRFQLDKRLAWLEPDDAATLERIEDVLRWRRLSLGETDAAFLDRADSVVESIDSELLVDVVRTRLEARTVIAALRRRRAGESAPGRYERWGYGRWLGIMASHWSEADFGLGRTFPWIGEADRLLADSDALGVDRLFMDYAWRELGRLGAGHYFDFEAVAIYVLRWDLIDRWTRYDGAVATERVLKLADEGLGGFREMFH